MHAYVRLPHQTISVIARDGDTYAVVHRDSKSWYVDALCPDEPAARQAADQLGAICLREIVIAPLHTAA
jgi:hypothetical protein